MIEFTWTFIMNLPWMINVRMSETGHLSIKYCAGI